MTEWKENFNFFGGPIVSRPYANAAPDTPIHIEQGVFVPNDPAGFYEIKNIGHYDGTVLSLHFFKDDWSTIEGSAVMIAPGIALTATHVVADLIDHVMKDGLEVACIGYTPTGLRHWHIRQVTNLHETDLTVLSLSYASPVPADGRFPQVMMTTRLPEIGETLTIAGFRASGAHIPLQADKYFAYKGGRLEFGLALRIGVGEVTLHHLNGRGSLARGPTIEVASHTEGGMSGGAVFDKNGMLVGVLSRGFDTAERHGPSLVSLAVPAILASIVPAFLPHLYSGCDTLFDLPPHIFEIDGRDLLRPINHPETGVRGIEVKGW